MTGPAFAVISLTENCSAMAVLCAAALRRCQLCLTLPLPRRTDRFIAFALNWVAERCRCRVPPNCALPWPCSARPCFAFALLISAAQYKAFAVTVWLCRCVVLHRVTWPSPSIAGSRFAIAERFAALRGSSTAVPCFTMLCRCAALLCRGYALLCDDRLCRGAAVILDAFNCEATFAFMCINMTLTTKSY